MARFWVGGAGNWSDNTNHWSATSGGSPGAVTPTSSDNVFIDGNSGSSFILTLDQAANCNNLDLSAALGSRISLNSHNISVAGSLALRSGGPASSCITGAATDLVNLTGSGTITSNGNGFQCGVTINSSGTYTIADSFNALGTNCTLTVAGGTFSITHALTTGSVAFAITGGTFIANLSGADTITCGSFVTTNSPTVTMNSTQTFIVGYKGTILGFSSGTTLSAANAQFNLFGVGTLGASFPSIIDLNGKTVSGIALAYSVGFDDTYTNSQYWRFNTSGTIGQLDVPQGVFMKGIAGTTLTITNCNVVGTSSLPCSIFSETASSNFNLCVTNSNFSWCNMQDIAATCSAINVTGTPTLTRVTGVTNTNPTAIGKAAALLLMI